MSDQIELESNRLDMVKKGSMNIHQAEKENEEWETVRTVRTYVQSTYIIIIYSSRTFFIFL